MKIFKPDNLGLLYRSLRIAGQNRLSLGLMAFFPFGNSGKDALLPEAQLWADAAAAVGANAVLDEGSPKSRGEFLVYGSAYAAAGTQAGEVAVSASLGAVKKSLMVYGDRHFNALGFITAPEPFTCMPVAPETAFGGENFSENPSGKGSAKVRVEDGSTVLPLPNVEIASKLVLGAGDKASPAGFWALPANAPERTRHLGSFDGRWLEKTWPHLPETTSPEYFQVAPPDQRLDGFFHGDEKISITGMHAEHARLDAALPALRARCFVNRRVQDVEEFSEIEARAETVWLFPGLACGIVLYRAVTNTLDEDADDILHVMAEWESMAEVPADFSHYREEFLKQLPQLISPAALATAAEATPVAAAMPAVAAAPLTPAAPIPEAAVMTSADVVAPGPELQELHQLAADLEKSTQEMMQKNGLTQADLAPYLKQEPEGPVPSLETVEKMAADLEAQARELMQKHRLTDRDIEQFMPKPEVESPNLLRDMEKALIDLNANTGATMKQAGLTQADINAFMAKTPEMADMVGQPVPDIKYVMAGLAAVMPVLAPLQAAAMPELTQDLPDPEPPAATSRLTREEVVARHAAKKSFAAYDLSGLDLAGLDLAGADFSSALLEKTSFKGCRLSGATFRDALLAGGDFSDADLGGTTLTGVSAGSALFAKARLDGSNASKADFTGADFSAAQLRNANIAGAIFDGSKMAGMKAGNCNAQRASFADCDLGAADFFDARLTAAVFTSAKLVDTNFSNSACDNAEFYGANAAKANFTNASLKASRADAASQFAKAQFGRSHLGRAAWEGVQLDGANLEGAVLDDADLSKANAADARFGRASAKGAKFDKADLSRADFTGVNLFKGSMRHTDTTATLLRRANLYGVDFYGTSPTIASLEGSNIDQTILLIRKPVV
ncbi:MAG: DUF2169 domain-containing protein [Pseudomonadota bacterium]